MFIRLVSIFLSLLLFIAPPASYAQGALDALRLPLPGDMLETSSSLIPPLLKGMVVNTGNPLAFRFVIDPGTTATPEEALRKTAEQQAKYFLAALTVSPDDLWVNLSPYEKNRMIPEALGKTDLGRDMLAQDYLLKQLSSSMIHPDKALGKEFWSHVYAKAKEQFGTTDIPMETFNKVWIMPDTAIVFEEDTKVYISQARLKVLLDEDYLALEKNRADTAVLNMPEGGDNAARALTTRIMREIVVPAITAEVNEGANFAPLRQIYHALILAKWYKETVTNQLLEQVYFDKEQMSGVDLADPDVREDIFERYVQAFKTGVFNYIKNEVDPSTGEATPRKYFSGGEELAFGKIPLKRVSDRTGLTGNGKEAIVDIKLTSAATLDPLRINALLQKLKTTGTLDPEDINELTLMVRHTGLDMTNPDSMKKAPEAVLQALSLLAEFDVSSYVETDPQTTELNKRLIEQLSLKLSLHELTHLTNSAYIIREYLPLMGFSSYFTDDQWLHLQEMSQHIFDDNARLKNLLSLFRISGHTAFSAFVLERIQQEIREAQQLNKDWWSVGKIIMRKTAPQNNTLRSMHTGAATSISVYAREFGFADMPNDHFAEVIKTIVLDLKQDYPDLDIKFAMPEKEDIGTFNYADMYQILSVLIDNARSAGAARIDISVKNEGTNIVLTLKDDGPGMPQVHVGMINRGIQFSTKGNGQGSGEGLIGVRKMLIEKYFGAMSVASTTSGEGKGTVFTLEFPVNDNAMIFSALAIAAIFPVDLSVITTGLQHIEETAGLDTFLTGISICSLTALALILRSFNGYKNVREVQLLERIHRGTSSSRVDALIQLKKTSPDSLPEREFLKLLNEPDAITPEVIFTFNEKERLEGSGFSFEGWLNRDIPSQLIHPEKKVRDRARDLLKNKVSLHDQGRAHIQAIHRELMRISKKEHSGLVRTILLELMDDMLLIQEKLQDPELGKEITKIQRELTIRDKALSAASQELRGGIDVSEVNITHTGKKISVAFDPAMLEPFLKGSFTGFKPVIVGLTPAASALSALGL